MWWFRNRSNSNGYPAKGNLSWWTIDIVRKYLYFIWIHWMEENVNSCYFFPWSKYHINKVDFATKSWRPPQRWQQKQWKFTHFYNQTFNVFVQLCNRNQLFTFSLFGKVTGYMLWNFVKVNQFIHFLVQYQKQISPVINSIFFRITKYIVKHGTTTSFIWLSFLINLFNPSFE